MQPIPSSVTVFALALCALVAALLVPAYEAAAIAAEPQVANECTQIFSTNSHMSNEEKQVMCRLYQSSTSLAQLGAIVTDSLERFMANQALVDASEQSKRIRFEKRKHEYLRFGRK